MRNRWQTKAGNSLLSLMVALGITVVVLAALGSFSNQLFKAFGGMREFSSLEQIRRHISLHFDCEASSLPNDCTGSQFFVMRNKSHTAIFSQIGNSHNLRVNNSDHMIRARCHGLGRILVEVRPGDHDNWQKLYQYPIACPIALNRGGANF